MGTLHYTLQQLLKQILKKWQDCFYSSVLKPQSLMWGKFLVWSKLGQKKSIQKLIRYLIIMLVRLFCWSLQALGINSDWIILVNLSPVWQKIRVIFCKKWCKKRKNWFKSIFWPVNGLDSTCLRWPKYTTSQCLKSKF